MSSEKWAFMGGFIIFVMASGLALLIGGIYSDTQARSLIEAMAPSLRTLCFAIITASATIISLLLTTVGFAHRLNNDFDARFYKEIKLIARLCTLLLILSVTILLILTMPITENDNLKAWFSAVYYVVIFSSGLLSALSVGTIILLYKTVDDIINVVYPDQDMDQ
ncbi:MAG: hypothetical protein RLP44_17830 [Aggregatilineales bacterium]